MNDKTPIPAEIAVHDLTLVIQEAQETLRAIRKGEVDALVVTSGDGPQVFMLKGVDHAHRALLETLNEGTATLSADGTILHANVKLAEMLGVPRDALLGTPLRAFVLPEHRDAFSALFEPGRSSSAKGRITLVRTGGGRVPVMLSMRAVRGTVAACTAVVTDLSEIEEAYTALQLVNQALEARIETRAAEPSRTSDAPPTGRERLGQELLRKADDLLLADQRKDEFLSMLAHELRNPLAPILLATEMMRIAAPAQPVVERYRRVIERQARNLARIVDDLLDVSRITRGTILLQRQRVELAPIVRSAIDAARSLIDAGGHTLSVKLPPEPVHLFADPTRFEQILVNLLNNAAKYTEHGGAIHVVAEQRGDTVLIRVRDNGVGIAPDLLPRVFDLFVQGDGSLARSKGGLGIGLKMVKSLVELHEGAVEAISDGPGRGTEIVVRVPIHRADLEQAASHDPGSTAAARGDVSSNLRVLVVEDNEDAAQMLVDLIRAWGHDVRVARNGEEGLALVGAFEPHAVLVDIGLPMMDGYEVARRLKAAAVHGPSGSGESPPLLICVTGYGQAQDRARALEAGIDHHLTKPPDTEVLRELLERRAALDARRD